MLVLSQEDPRNNNREVHEDSVTPSIVFGVEQVLSKYLLSE